MKLCAVCLVALLVVQALASAQQAPQPAVGHGTAPLAPQGGDTSPAPMQDALRLSMGSLMGFCRCESCEQVIGDLIDNLEDDFPGRTYQEGDVYALINDRFCYGVRWVYRSACRYILSKYMDETIQLLMMEASEREVCETLRFCW